jgi:hypothetical protein
VLAWREPEVVARVWDFPVRLLPVPEADRVFALREELAAELFPVLPALAEAVFLPEADAAPDDFLAVDDPVADFLVEEDPVP